MDKYLALRHHLQNLRQSSWKVNFSEIENIIGASLPPSARLHREWWGNDQQNGRHWLKVGWKTKHVDIHAETLTFFRDGMDVFEHLNKNDQDIGSADCALGEPFRVVSRLEMEWRTLGKVLRDQRGNLVFPKVGRCPAIYRFHIHYSDSEEIYIGETENLQRRFYHYRNPGPSQKTNIRINAILKNAIENSAEISISAVTENAWITRGDKTETADLSVKFVRCIFENAAIFADSGTSAKILNKAKH